MGGGGGVGGWGEGRGGLFKLHSFLFIRIYFMRIPRLKFGKF